VLSARWEEVKYISYSVFTCGWGNVVCIKEKWTTEWVRDKETAEGGLSKRTNRWHLKSGQDKILPLLHVSLSLIVSFSVSNVDPSPQGCCNFF